jgi:hypothetical protein
MPNQGINTTTKADNKTEPNGRAMSKVMTMFNGHGRGRTQFSQRHSVWIAVQYTEFCDHERRAMSTDHRLDSAWFGAGAAIKQRGLEQALRMVA